MNYKKHQILKTQIFIQKINYNTFCSYCVAGENKSIDKKKKSQSGEHETLNHLHPRREHTPPVVLRLQQYCIQ